MSPAAHPLSPPRVLLVDDHADTVRVTAHLLNRAGYEVRTATTVGEALQIAAGEPLSVVVSDIGLPDASGYDLMRQLRERHAIPGIAVSGFGSEEDRRLSAAAGFVGHVLKPVKMSELKEAIAKALAT